MAVPFAQTYNPRRPEPLKTVPRRQPRGADHALGRAPGADRGWPEHRGSCPGLACAFLAPHTSWLLGLLAAPPPRTRPPQPAAPPAPSPWRPVAAPPLICVGRQ